MSATPIPNLSRKIADRVTWRSLALQASWNPRRMQHMGLLATISPWIRERDLGKRDRRRLIRDHFGYFNTNPYLANYLIGGLLRLEDEALPAGGGYERTIRSFKTTLMRALASLGDQLFWLGLQPALLMLSALFALAGCFWGALVPVGVFAVWQMVFRRRALDVGYRLGMDIVDLLGAPTWHRSILILKRAGAVLTGVFGAWITYQSGHLALDSEQRGAVLTLALTLGLTIWLRRRLPGEVLLLLLLPLALALTYL